MKCPICKRELRRSQKNPEHGLCDNCRKRFKWVDEYNYYNDEDEYEDEEPVTYNNPKSIKSQNPSRKPSYNESPKKKPGCLKIALIVVGALILLGVIGNLLSGKEGKETTDKKTTTPATTTETKTSPKEEKTEFTISETASQKDVEITLVSATESAGSEFIKPDDGNIFLLLEFDITNNSSKDINISSIANFEAYCDDYSLTQDILGLQAPENSGKNQLDGAVASGKKMNGVIAYQVPSGFANFEINVSPDFWSSKNIKFVIHK